MPPWVEQVIDALREPAILLDENGRVSRTNAPARDRFGAWVAGQNYVGVLRQPALLGPVEDAFFGGTAGHARFVHTEAEVETTFDVRVTPIPGLGRGGRPAVLLAFHDTSHASVDAAVRRDFVANVSHELKTPLTAVMGFVETLRGPARDDRAAQERFLGIMAQELSRMDRLVADLLSLSRVETQLRQRPRGTVDLSVLIGEAVDLLSPVAAEAGVSCRWDAPEAAPVAGDRDQLLQVVVNLAENGIKYGARPGEVAIRPAAHPARARDPRPGLGPVGDGWRARRARRARPPPDGAVLPRRHGPQPRAGRHGAGAVHREAHRQPSPGTAAHRQRHRTGDDGDGHAAGGAGPTGRGVAPPPRPRTSHP